MDSIDKLLSQIKTDSQTPAKTPKLPKQQPIVPPLESKSDLDKLLEEVKADFSNLPVTSKSSEKNQPAIDNILSQVKTNYDKQERVQEQQLQAEKLKQIEALKIRAKSWLKQLDPLSTEGLWFERFAEGYPTKLEAAVNYLQES